MKNLNIFILSFIVIGFGADLSYAEQTIVFGPQDTKIMGSIAYTVMGEYRAQFNAFKGRIILDDNSKQVRSVYLEIEANTIHSNCPWCDRAARSRRLLNTAKYPLIIFKSDRIIRDEGGLKVQGVLEMHGVRKKMIFPFKEEFILDHESHRKWLDLRGSWRIDRKEFNINWNKYLDHGGVLVGNEFTVDWDVKV